VPRSRNIEGVDWLVRLAEAIERLVKEEKGDRDPPSAHRIPHDDAMRFVRGVKRYVRGDAKSLGSALVLKRKGRRFGSYKRENLKRAEEALRLRKQGMTWEDIAQTLYGDRSEPPTVQYLQVLVERFGPVIEDKWRKAIVRKLHRRWLAGRQRRAMVRKLRRQRLARRRLLSKPALKQAKNRAEAIWVDPSVTPKDLFRMVRRQRNASSARKRRDPN
jgi:hypothetical protein